jgi:predicted transcriptional regulator
MTPGEREQYKRGPYKRGPYKSPATQGRILGKALVGMSGREIARSEGVNRDTVKRILTQSEMHEAIIEGRRRFTELIPLALEVYRRTLKEAKGPYATSVAKDVLSGGQVSVPRTEALLESKEVESDRSTEDLFFKALHGHWPEEECHCGEAKKDGREPEPPKGKGVKV